MGKRHRNKKKRLDTNQITENNEEIMDSEETTESVMENTEQANNEISNNSEVDGGEQKTNSESNNVSVETNIEENSTVDESFDGANSDTNVESVSEDVNGENTEIVDTVSTENESTETAEVTESQSENKVEENNDEEAEASSNEEKAEEKVEAKQTVKSDDKPEYAKEMMRRRKKRTIIIVTIILLILIGTALSTVFALINSNSVNIAQGVFVKNIDISGLSVDEAREKVKKAVEIELQSPVKMEYQDYSSELEPSAVNYTYDIDKAINEAYSVGRDGNLVQNNYAILFSMLLKKNIDLDETYNKELLQKTIDDVSVKIPGVVENPSYYIETENNTLVIVKGKDGMAVKQSKLEEKILDNIKNRNYEKIRSGEKVESIAIPVENKKAEAIDINKIHNEVKKDPVDAYLVEEPFELHPEVNGTDFAISIEEAKSIVSENKEEYEIPLKEIPASYTVYDIGMEAFPYTLSEFSTYYDSTNYNRSTNLELAAEKIDGTILMPGEVFSYNQVVGKRTIEAGFKSAAIYTNGGVEDGLGGGICQISSTLYNAVLLANLEVVERENHMFKTSYVGVGRDATVSYGSIDFQFMNSRKYPVRIEAEVGGGVATISIHGITEEVEYDVEIIPVVTATIPYSVEYVDDPSLEAGVEVGKGGTPGSRVTTTKELWLDGELVSSEVISNDVYRPMNRTVRVGTGD